LPEYRRRSVMIGRLIRVQPPTGTSYTAVAQGIDECGRLQIRTNAGNIVNLETEEIHLL
jgi:biotin-(acetyl-CoA carboxylase) ligase